MKGPRKPTLRCPSCSQIVQSYFDHVAIPCQHDMTPEEIAALLQAVTERTNPKC